MSISTGWSLDYVRWHVDLPTLADLNAYWERYPPLQIMIAAYLGIGKDKVDKNKQQSFEEFMSSIPSIPFQAPGVRYE